ncbi:MAG TPA: hypothetical protein VMS77_07950 [Conexivisphaerales archaeon]|nr:hypothetical protein [Conexivisphaerales archaeon]
MSKPGPKANLTWNLRQAAIMYAIVLENGDEDEHEKAWDRLRKAAKRYRDGEPEQGRKNANRYEWPQSAGA